MQALVRAGRRLAVQPAVTTRLVSTSWTCGAAEPVRQEKKDAGGWGSTRVADLLRSKGHDNGAWLWCSRDDLVIEAVRKMTKGSVGSLLVFDASKIGTDGKPSEEAVVGIITERDYLTKMVVQGKSSLNTKVEDIMTHGANGKLITARPSDTVLEVMEDMVDKSIRHVPVVDTDGTMVGMVSMRDVVNVMVKEHREEVGQLQEYIQGSY